MAFNVDVFKNSGLIYGGARPSLFQVDLTFPAELSRSVANRRFSFTCRATSIPGSTVQAVEVPYFGRTVKLAGDRTFDNWNVTVMNDEDYTVRNAFEDWSNALNSMVGNQRLISVGTSGALGGGAATSTGGYKMDALITHFSKGGQAGGPGANGISGTPIKQYVIVGIFPIDVASMGMDWDSTNQIQTFDVTFAYDYWLPVNAGINTGAAGNISNLIQASGFKAAG